MPSLADLLSDPGLRINLVVQIGSDYFADQAPDSDPSGLINHSVGLLGAVEMPGPEVDILNGDASIPSGTIQLADVWDPDLQAFEVTSWYGANANGIYQDGLECAVWAGAIGQGMAFPADYQRVATLYVRTAKKTAGVWELGAVDVTVLADVPAFSAKSFLTVADAEDANLVLESADGFEDSGYWNCDSEWGTYASKTDGPPASILTVTRGELGSQSSSHSYGAEVKFVKRLEGPGPLLALQLLVSPFGGGSYDVLSDGAGVDEGLVDVAAFEALAAEFAAYPMTIYLTQVDSVLSLCAQELLLPYGCRLVTKNGKISVAKVDVFDPAVPFVTVDADHASGIPELGVTSDEIWNEMQFSWDWLPGTGNFSSQRTFVDADSQAKYNRGNKQRRAKEFQFKSQIEGGDALMGFTQAKLVLRFGQPLSTVTVTADRVAFLSSPGDDVRLVSPHLPGPGAGMGHDAFMEVISSRRDQNGFCELKLQYPSYSGYRMGLIAPSPLVVSVPEESFVVDDPSGGTAGPVIVDAPGGGTEAAVGYSQTVFDVEEDAALLRPGYALRLWDDGSKAYLPDSPNVIASVSGSTVTMEAPWDAGGLAVGVRVRFADYDDCSDEQRLIFAFVAGNEAEFDVDKAGGGTAGPVTVDAPGGGEEPATVDTESPAFDNGDPPYQIVP